jgi:hypothetical protein
MKYKVYETNFKGRQKLLGEIEGDPGEGIVAVLALAKEQNPNLPGLRVLSGDVALDWSESLCIQCGLGKIGMWVGNDKESRHVIRVCPKCEGQERVGKVSS